MTIRGVRTFSPGLGRKRVDCIPARTTTGPAGS